MAVGDGVRVGSTGVGDTAVGGATAVPWLQADSSKISKRRNKRVILVARDNFASCI
ncbi:MAG: hypothetical protein HND44_20605 [Chloroflexi bacterium]|nr:hypothetical protein [Chloroflexota bacterium]